MRYLLDKNVIRRAVEGLVKIKSNRQITLENEICLAVLGLSEDQELFVSEETLNILERSVGKSIQEAITPCVKVLYPTKYFRRWTRRLRGFGFTGEDAKILSIAVFGREEEKVTLGADFVVTNDKHLIAKYKSDFHHIEKRFRAMTSHLQDPFNLAILPELVTADEVIDRIER